jgi:succinate dehydrogenase / fumarate reductase, membrane anchor subunit
MKKIEIAPPTKTGSHHWLLHRISAVILIPLIAWFLFSAIVVLQDVDANLVVFFANPLNAILSIALIAVALYHGSAGIAVVLEDYVANASTRLIFIYGINILSILTAIAVIFAIIRLHFIG